MYKTDVRGKLIDGDEKSLSQISQEILAPIDATPATMVVHCLGNQFADVCLGSTKHIYYAYHGDWCLGPKQYRGVGVGNH